MTEPRPVEEIARGVVWESRHATAFWTDARRWEFFSFPDVQGRVQATAVALTAERQRAETVGQDIFALLLAIKRRNERIDALEAALLHVIGSSFELNDARIGYVTLQVDRGDLGHARALLDTQQAP